MLVVVDVNEKLCHLGDGAISVECGPARLREVATEKLLSDKETAPHYKVGNRDSDGKFIKLGKEMTFIDWRGKKTPHVWYVYEWQVDVEEVQPDGSVRLIDKYVEVDIFPTKEAACEFASKRLKGKS